MTNIDMLHYINPIVENVRKTLLENQFASGGLALGIIGGTVAILRPYRHHTSYHLPT